MKEYTYIEQEIPYLIIQLEGCKYYEDARILLNAVTKDLAKNYGGDVKEVKLAVFDAIIHKLNEVEIFAKEVLDRCDDEIKREEWQYVTMMRQSEKRPYLLRIWMKDWRKELAPTIGESVQRLRPIEGMEQCVDIMFERLKKCGYLAKDESKEVWCYLCGTNDNEPEKQLEWKGDFLAFCVLYDRFLASADNKYFKFENGLQPFIISLFGYRNINSFKTRLSRYKDKKRGEMSAIWNAMRDPQMR